MQSLEPHTYSERKLPQLAETCQSTQRATVARRRFALVRRRGLVSSRVDQEPLATRGSPLRARQTSVLEGCP